MNCGHGSLTCLVSPRRALWGFGIAAPPVWSSSGSPAHTSSEPPRSGERHAWSDLSTIKVFGSIKNQPGTKARLTFLKPSRTPFMFSYLLKRSAKERSTELRSAIAWSRSADSCLTDLLQEMVFCCCSSSANQHEKSKYKVPPERRLDGYNLSEWGETVLSNSMLRRVPNCFRTVGYSSRLW